MFIARTSRSTGMGVGPLGFALLAIGALMYAALVALGVVIAALVVAAKWGADEVRARRRRQATAPHPAPGTEPWARGHREPTLYERSLAARSRR